MTDILGAPSGDRLRSRLSFRVACAVLLVGVVVGCNQQAMKVEPPRVEFTRPPPPTIPDTDVNAVEKQRTEIVVQRNPQFPTTPGRSTSQAGDMRLQGGDTVQGTFDQMPLPAFINSVFGELLKLNYQMDPAVANRPDLVTLRTAGPKTREDMLAITREVLASYGLQVTRQGDLYRIVPSDVLAGQMPDIITSRALPDVPGDLRPIFQIVPVDQIKAGDIQSMIGNIFGQKTKMQAISGTNAIMMLGLPQDVRAAMIAIKELDRPIFANRRSVRLEPVYWTAAQLGARLVDIAKVNGLNAGYGVATETPITILPVPQINAILIFAPDQRMIEFFVDWARRLDQPAQAEDSKKFYVYFVRNTKAQQIVETIKSVLTGGLGGGQSQRVQAQAVAQAGAPVPGQAGGGPAPGTVAAQPVSESSAGIIVDEYRNAIIFTGTASEWAKIQPLIETLDRAIREALIEVTVMDVTLDDDVQAGVEWLLTAGPATGTNATFGTLGTGSSAPQGGLTVRVFNGTDLRAVLRAFASDARVNVISNPRVLARSGGEAKIQVGTDVPFITSQGQSNITVPGGTSAVLQSIQYRTTGVVLSVKPTIHAGRRIDLEVSQEVSEVGPNLTPGIASPSIDTRKVTTQLSMQDGSTVLIGGLIKQTRSASNSGVPLLKDVPVLGQLFRSEEEKNRRQELVILITPYIIQSDEDLQVLTDAFRRRVESFGQDDKTITRSLLRP